jgi:hypothetical protein
MFMGNPRAVKYRRLALAEPDQEKAKLLHQIAEEAERGVLVTADWRRQSSTLPGEKKRPDARGMSEEP